MNERKKENNLQTVCKKETIAKKYKVQGGKLFLEKVNLIPFMTILCLNFWTKKASDVLLI